VPSVLAQCLDRDRGAGTRRNPPWAGGSKLECQTHGKGPGDLSRDDVPQDAPLWDRPFEPHLSPGKCRASSTGKCCCRRERSTPPASPPSLWSGRCRPAHATRRGERSSVPARACARGERRYACDERPRHLMPGSRTRRLQLIRTEGWRKSGPPRLALSVDRGMGSATRNEASLIWRNPPDSPAEKGTSLSCSIARPRASRCQLLAAPFFQ
jgi:hypothetical protein